MYVLLADMVHRFIYLKLGLALVLARVGIKMGLHGIVKIPTTISLGVIIAILAVSIVARFRNSRNAELKSAEGVNVDNRVKAN